MGNKKLYNFIYRICRGLVSPYVKLRYSFNTDVLPKMDEPFLLLSNHTTEDDMFFTAEASAQPVYFVCGEHLLRNKLYGRILRTLLDPVPVPKGGSAAPAVMQMIKRLKAGENLCMFYEGKRSYHGETIPAPVTLGALVKKAGCALVTYRISGGFFTYPRWARNNKRRGHAEGHVAGVYSSSVLSGMSAEEITEIINRDTYENAYSTQRSKKWIYKGNDLAKGLDTVLFICPECRKEDTVETDGDRFFCRECSLEGRYNKYGFLEGEKLPYDNVLDWMRWIEKEFDLRVSRTGDSEAMFTSDDTELYTMNKDYTNDTVCTGKLTVYKNKMDIGGYSFDLGDIPYMSVLYGDILLFTYKGEYYGLTGKKFKAWKCARLWHIKKGDINDRAKEI